ncbi:hypothetical protein EK21DRAFT_118952 [Setomelanomma holmii]|uniref:Uncharacterized protein n=1 Tax=Setomelanomma holmii TaxID=210430 RepID=A0A9P4GWH6_9PLEO|nr:hypothetical protein EK21DRAFT_118952 [Setomelanomma holmii]
MRLLTTLLNLLPLTLSSPTPTQSTSSTTPSSSNTFQIFDFRAYISSNPTTDGNYNIASFMIPENGFTCAVISEEPVYSDITWYPCNPPSSGSEETWSFRISEGFGQVVLRKEWSVNGMYFTGFAPQDTYWSEGYGGNVTSFEGGKFYDRFEPWGFEITSVIG